MEPRSKHQEQSAHCDVLSGAGDRLLMQVRFSCSHWEIVSLFGNQFLVLLRWKLNNFYYLYANFKVISHWNLHNKLTLESNVWVVGPYPYDWCDNSVRFVLVVALQQDRTIRVMLLGDLMHPAHHWCWPSASFLSYSQGLFGRWSKKNVTIPMCIYFLWNDHNILTQYNWFHTVPSILALK